MNVAIIPARGGSKRIARKNIRDFCGKPIISYSIEAALNSACFDSVIVSTDDDAIAEIAQHYGAETPFLRPAELADDYATTTPVINHSIEWLQKNRESPDLVCCIYATAPFVSSKDLQIGLDMLENSDAKYAFSVTAYPSPIQRAMKITPDGRVKMLEPNNFNIRSQDLEPAYHDAAQFYWGRASAFLTDTQIFCEESIPVLVPRYRVQDIDTMDDWYYAELIFRALNNN